MVSEEQTRKMVQELTRAAWVRTRTVGSHSNWDCCTGTHSLSVVDGHRTTSPAMVTKIRRAIGSCDCKEGQR